MARHFPAGPAVLPSQEMAYQHIEDIVRSRSLTYEQKVMQLAQAAENLLTVLDIPPDVQQLRDADIICDLFEGAAPYRPRYVLPDYAKFLAEGSEFLGIAAPGTLEDAITALMILYHHVPSITGFPVYVGALDELLEPFHRDESETRRELRRFLTWMDGTITDSFCHANIGPRETTVGRIILELERTLQHSVPNLSLLVDDSTPTAFLDAAIGTALATAKPSFANRAMFADEFRSPFGIASCYNGLPIGGGAFTLSRLKLGVLAERAISIEHFTDHLLPHAANAMLRYMDERVRFLTDESGFFASSFLVREGLIAQERFTAMFGLVGLAEAVNNLMKLSGSEARFGHSTEADDLGERIVRQLAAEVERHQNPLLAATDGRYLLHAQVGLASDSGSSPGCRIPIGEEPALIDHILQASRFHRYFPSGIGDIFPFDETVDGNPQAVRDILSGAFTSGMRYVSIYGHESDVVRITGYLVKRSEIAKLERGEAVMKDTVALGMGAQQNQHLLDRKVRSASSQA